jgi:hypothetical protein
LCDDPPRIAVAADIYHWTRSIGHAPVAKLWVAQ